MDAIPSVRRWGPAGGSGLFQDTDVANITGPLNPHRRRLAPSSRRVRRDSRGGFVGTRSAKMVDCGAPEARPAQGRVGVDHDPRHATLPLVTHHPLLVGTSGSPDTARPRSRRCAPWHSRSGVVTTARFATSRRVARTMVAVNRSPHASRHTALARSRVAGNMAAGRGPSRGKGVRAA